MRSQSKEIQQSFYLRLGDRDWDKYEGNEYEFLKRKIGFALYGNPENDSENDGGYNKDQNEQIETIFDVLIKNGCCNETSGTLLISIIFVVCEQDDHLFVVPVFKIRKCQNSPRSNCQLFVDNLGRVYKSFQNFLLENLLPKCIMIVPRDGTYKGRIKSTADSEPQIEVILDEFESPACSLQADAVNIGDKVSTVVGIGSSVLMVASIIPAVAVAPALLTGSLVASAGVGAWGLVRGISILYDRATHDQSIGLNNTESQMCYLSIAGGITFAATAGASAYITSATKNGLAVSQTARMTYNAVVVSSVILNGTGIINSGYNIFIEYQEGRKPTPLEIFQFTTQVLFFSHSVINMRSANNIIRDTQASTIKEYEQSLRSNRHRKMFRKATLEARRIHGHEVGNQETIRGIKHINNKDEFFAGLIRVNKDFNKNQARFTITSDGQIQINSAHIVDPMEFWSVGTSGRQQVFQNLPAPQPTLTHAEFITNHTRINANITELFSHIPMIIQNIYFSNDATEVLTIMISHFTEVVQNYIMQLLVNFSNVIDDYVANLEIIFPFKEPIVIFLQYLIHYCKSGDNNISVNNRSIEQMLRNLLEDQIQFHRLLSSFGDWIKAKIESLLSETYSTNENQTNTIRVVCPDCHGYFYSIKN